MVFKLVVKEPDVPSSEHIINVSEADFQYEVLAYSSQRPVVVDFWANWCQPCKMLSPLLERMAQEGNGSFRLAKVDVDANPSLVMQYGVQGIPAVKAFRNGQMVAEFTGLRTEQQVRDFLRTLAPQPDDLAISRGNYLLTQGDWQLAAASFQRVLQQDQDNAAALLGLARSHLSQGQADLALPILREFPPSNEYKTAEQLTTLAEAMGSIVQIERQADEDDLAATYANALRLAGRGNIPSAIDGLFDILRADKHYREGEARKCAVGLLHLLGEEHPLSKEYRAELSSLLF